jgi:hypothetical protein
VLSACSLVGCVIACPIGYHCDDYGTTKASRCGNGRTSLMASSSIHSCTCLPGSYGLNGSTSCVMCPHDHYCHGDNHIAPCGYYMQAPLNSTSHVSCTCRSPRVGLPGGPCSRPLSDGTSLSRRILALPDLSAGLTNQIICLEEIVSIAKQLDAVLCWPRVNVHGIQSLVSTTRPFEHLFAKKWFEVGVKKHYQVSMASKPADLEMCDFAIATQVLASVVYFPTIRIELGLSF